MNKLTKIVTFFVLFTLLFSLVACDSNETNIEPKENVPEEVTPVEPVEEIVIPVVEPEEEKPQYEIRKTVISKEIDDLTACENVEETLDSDDYTVLNEGEIEFDGEDYDYETRIVFTESLQVLHSGCEDADTDFESKVALVMNEGGAVKYEFVFDDDFPWEDVTDDDSIEIPFMGKVIKVVKAEDDSLRLVYGEEIFMDAGDEYLAGDKVVLFEKAVGGDTVLVQVDGVRDTIEEDDTEKVNGVEIFVEAVADDEGIEYDSAKLFIGVKAHDTVDDGDAYFGQDEDDPAWVWAIDLDENLISVQLDITAEDVDDDGYLKIGDCLALPNSYSDVCFYADNHPDKEDYSGKYEDRDDVKYYTLLGEWKYDNGKKINKLWYNGSDMFVKDSGDMVEIEDVTFRYVGEALNYGINNIDFDLTVVTFDFDEETITSLMYDGVELVDDDEDIRSAYGYVIEDPENNCEDGELKIKSLPEEQLEYRIVVQKLIEEKVAIKA